MKVFALFSLVVPALGGTTSSYSTADCTGTASTATVDESSLANQQICVAGIGIRCNAGALRYEYYPSSDTTCATPPTQTCAAASMASSSSLTPLGANCYIELPQNVCVLSWNVTFLTSQIMQSMMVDFACPSGGGSNPCFPSSSMVTMADGTASRVDALKEGDTIVATTADGTLTTDTVSLLSIAEPEVRAPFVVLATAANQTLTLTEAHHISVGAKCCATLKQAKDVAVGETVWAAQHAGAAVATTVMAKTYTTASGLHSPVLTNGGFPVVDGLVTAFDSIEKMTLAKHGLAPLLKTCKATGTCETFKRLFLGDDAKYIA